MRKKIVTVCLEYLKMIAQLTVYGVFIALGTMLAWNSLTPSLFHGPSMSFLQAYYVYGLTLMIAATFKVVDGYWSS